MEQIYGRAFPLTEKQEQATLTHEAADLGYEGLYIIQNSGSIGIFVVLIAFQQLFASLLTRVTSKGGKVNNWARSKKSSFRWAGFTTFLNEIYLNLAFACCINAYALGTSSSTTTFMSIMTVTVGLLEIFWPIKVACDLNKTMKVPMPLIPFSEQLEGGELE